MDYGKKAIALHKKFHGKLETVSRVAVKNKKDLSLVYTPGVGAVSGLIAKDQKLSKQLTLSGRTVAVISDGSAVLGLGNLGPYGAMPVMEGKCILFKTFAGLDAFPIVLNTQDTKEIIQVVKAIAPTFAGINLEDFSAPRCFEIEDALQGLGIPVMHDDQHGTAIAVIGALMGAVKVAGKRMQDLKVVISGAGAAGSAVAKMLDVREVVMVDSKGIIYKGRDNLDANKEKLADMTNPKRVSGDLREAMWGADVFIGLSAPGILKPEFIKGMNADPIVFAMANPVPEIMPDLAKKAGVRLIATGRSDFPNQVNNALIFPGVFKGAIEVGATKITMQMKKAAAVALSSMIKKPTEQNFVPSIFDKNVVKVVSTAVKRAYAEQ